jgi:acetate kinase
VYESDSKQVVVAGSASNVQGDSPAKYKFKYRTAESNDLKEEQSRELDKSTSYQDVFEDILNDVTSSKVLGDDGKERLTVVAHRIVHGGTAKDAVVIKHGDKGEQETLDRMDQVSAFAPLHVSIWKV